MIKKDFTIVPNTLIRSSALSSLEKVVWCYIASMRDGHKYTVRSACKALGINTKTWRRCVSKLQRRGMVSVKTTPGKTNVFSAIRDLSIWDLPPAKGVGCSNSTPTPEDPSPIPNACTGTPYNKENYYNTIDDDVREKLKQEVMIDANIELACVSCGITSEQYKQFAAMIIADWDFQDLDDREWTKKHFMSVLRYKVAGLKKENNGHQITKDIDRASDPLTRAAIHTANIG